MTFSCSPPQLVACTFLSAAGSFLSLPSAPSPAGDFSARLQFRTWNPDGLLLSAWLNPERRGLELRINGSRLQLTLRGARPAKSEAVAGEWTGKKMRRLVGNLGVLSASGCVGLRHIGLTGTRSRTDANVADVV